MGYRRAAEKKGSADVAPKRIIFYRGWYFHISNLPLLKPQTWIDGVSEGQFEQVLRLGLQYPFLPMTPN